MNDTYIELQEDNIALWLIRNRFDIYRNYVILMADTMPMEKYAIWVGKLLEGYYSQEFEAWMETYQPHVFKQYSKFRSVSISSMGKQPSEMTVS